jgi:membrane associated rhomboid family serine protease
MTQFADLLNTRFGVSVGASLGLCGVLGYLCRWRKAAQLPVVNLPLGWLFWGLIVAAAALIVVASDPSLPHVGHFVALLVGAVSFRFWKSPAQV